MEEPNYFPLLDIYRSDYIDCRFYALIGLYDKNGALFEIGQHNNAKFFLRSMMKPIQASILADDKIYEYFNFTLEEIAVMQGSHSGSPKHIKLVESILKKIGLDETSLLCPVIPPLDLSRYKEEQNYTALHNNCSGKHSMMLAYCVYNHLDISNYTDFNHPMQLKIKEKLIKYSQTDDIIATTDGCGTPVFGLELRNIAKAILNFYADEKNKVLIEAYKNNPLIIGGYDNFGKRSDTKIMQLSPFLLSKVGACGFIYVFNIKNKQVLIVKMAQNNNPEREILTLELLYRLNWLNERYFDDKIYTESKMPVGKYKFAFSKDKNFFHNC